MSSHTQKSTVSPSGHMKLNSIFSSIVLLMPSFVIVVQLLSRVRLFATSWTAECQASLSFTISWSMLRFMSIESVMLSNAFYILAQFNLLSQDSRTYTITLISLVSLWSLSLSTSIHACCHCSPSLCLLYHPYTRTYPFCKVCCFLL